MEFPENIVAERHEISKKWVLWYLTDTQATLCSQALQFSTWIDEQIASAKEDAEEDSIAPNSYGAGYNSGVMRGLLDAKEFMEEPYVAG